MSLYPVIYPVGARFPKGALTHCETPSYHGERPLLPLRIPRERDYSSRLIVATFLRFGIGGDNSQTQHRSFKVQYVKTIEP